MSDTDKMNRLEAEYACAQRRQDKYAKVAAGLVEILKGSANPVLYRHARRRLRSVTGMFAAQRQICAEIDRDLALLNG